MSANAIPISTPSEPRQESLTERLARNRLPISETLGHAVRIATSLRDMHLHGLAYGAVSPQFILLGPSGAALRSSGGLAHLGDARGDVKAFGVVLDEMLRRTDGPAGLLEELRVLAARCQEKGPQMQKVMIALRVLGVRARVSTAATPGPVLVSRPKEAAEPHRLAIRIRFRVSDSLRPLARLAVFALGGR